MAAQGVLIRRHRIEKSDGSFFAPGDFVVGDNVSFYGRTFHIVDADVFTRQTLADAGLEYGPAEAYPDDPFTTKRLSMQRHTSGQAMLPTLAFCCCPLLPFAAARCCLLLLPAVAFYGWPIISFTIVLSCQALLQSATAQHGHFVFLSCQCFGSCFLAVPVSLLACETFLVSHVTLRSPVGVRSSVTIGCTKQSLLSWSSQPCCSHGLSSAAAALHSIRFTSYTLFAACGMVPGMHRPHLNKTWSLTCMQGPRQHIDVFDIMSSCCRN